MAYSKQRRNKQRQVQTDEGVNMDLRHDATCPAACRKSFNARATNDDFRVQDSATLASDYDTRHWRKSKIPDTPVRPLELEALEKNRQKPSASSAYNTSLCSTLCDTIP